MLMKAAEEYDLCPGQVGLRRENKKPSNVEGFLFLSQGLSLDLSVFQSVLTEADGHER